MEKTVEDRILKVKKKFQSLLSNEDKYNYLIELGRASPPYPQDFRTPDRIVPGCQSVLYLDAQIGLDGKLEFRAHSEALISQGLAALLIQIYSGLPPELILLTPPLFLHELGLFASLSPSRSNGFASIYTRMRQIAVKNLLPVS